MRALSAARIAAVAATLAQTACAKLEPPPIPGAPAALLSNLATAYADDLFLQDNIYFGEALPNLVGGRTPRMTVIQDRPTLIRRYTVPGIPDAGRHPVRFEVTRITTPTSLLDAAAPRSSTPRSSTPGSSTPGSSTPGSSTIEAHAVLHFEGATPDTTFDAVTERLGGGWSEIPLHDRDPSSTRFAPLAASDVQSRTITYAGRNGPHQNRMILDFTPAGALQTLTIDQSRTDTD